MIVPTHSKPRSPVIDITAFLTAEMPGGAGSSFASQRLVYLAVRAVDGTPTAIEEIAAIAGVSERVAYRALKALRSFGLVARDQNDCWQALPLDTEREPV